MAEEAGVTLALHPDNPPVAELGGVDDHVPHMMDDTVWGHRGRAYATGYIKGLRRAVAAESRA